MLFFVRSGLFLVISVFAMAALFAVQCIVVVAQFEAAFDELHPQIASLGYTRFFAVSSTRRLILKPGALSKSAVARRGASALPCSVI